MDFEIDEAHKMLAGMVRDFMEKEIEPVAEQIDTEDKFPDWTWERLAERGLLGATIPEKYGGSGFDYLAQVICLEEMSRVCVALSVSVGAH